MGLVSIKREIEQVDYAANQLKTRELPRDNAYRALYLRLSGTYTTSATAPVTRHSFTPYTLIKRLEIVANGKKTIKSIPFWKVYLENTYDYGAAPYCADVGEATSTAYAFVAEGFLHFGMPRSRRPIDTLLDARGLETLTMKVTWGSETDLHTTINAAALSATKLEISTHEYTNLPGDFKSGILVENHIEHEITATKSNELEKLPVDTIYRRLWLITMVGDVLTVYGTNAVLNKLTVKSGTLVFQQLPAEDFRRRARVNYNLEKYTDMTDGSFREGVYPVDFITDGQITEAINTVGMSSFNLEMDVTKQTGTNIIHILPDTIEGL
jgi:hypothetical protein